MLFGPNAAGKTALVAAIAGLPAYTVTAGEIRFRGEDIATLGIDERARLGIGFFLQRPPVLHGLTLRELLAMSRPRLVDPDGFGPLAAELGCAELLDRDVAVPQGSSGVGSVDALVDLDVQLRLEGPGTSAESVSRAIARLRSSIEICGSLIGQHDDRQGRLDCRGLLVSPAARIVAIPELHAECAPAAQLSHEATIGPISEEAIEYVMTRGVPRDGAVSAMTRGFLEAGLPPLARPLRDEIDELTAAGSAGAL